MCTLYEFECVLFYFRRRRRRPSDFHSVVVCETYANVRDRPSKHCNSGKLFSRIHVWYSVWSRALHRLTFVARFRLPIESSILVQCMRACVQCLRFTFTVHRNRSVFHFDFISNFSRKKNAKKTSRFHSIWSAANNERIAKIFISSTDQCKNSSTPHTYRVQKWWPNWVT